MLQEQCSGHRLLAVTIMIGLRLVGLASATGTLCYRDKNPSNPDPYNMYQCNDSDKPNCCQEGDLSTCCNYDPTQRTILQQLTIWGLLLATMAGLIIIYLCCFRARNNSGTEIRSSDEQDKTYCCSNCCFLSNRSGKDGQKSGRRYKEDIQDQI